MSRGDRREASFYDDADRVEFLSALGRACLKTGWQVRRRPGHAGYRIVFSEMRRAFPDMSVTPEIIEQDEDSIALAYTLTGTHTGPLGKIPPSGKRSRCCGIVIRVYDDAGNVIETHEHKGDFKDW